MPFKDLDNTTFSNTTISYFKTSLVKTYLF